MVSSLNNGTTYEFQVRAVNGVGPGPWSSTASATPAAPCTVPGAPGNFRTTGISDDHVHLAWDAPSNGGCTITDYQVRWRRWHEVSGPGDHWDSWTTPVSNGTSTTMRASAEGAPGLDHDTTYEFEVWALNSVGPGASSTIQRGNGLG